jgi:hypothetical protein
MSVTPFQLYPFSLNVLKQLEMDQEDRDQARLNYIPITLVLEEEAKGWKFKASPGYIVRLGLKKKKKKNETRNQR